MVGARTTARELVFFEGVRKYDFLGGCSILFVRTRFKYKLVATFNELAEYC